MNNTQNTTVTNADTLIIEISDDEFSYCSFNQHSNTPLFIHNQPIDKNSTQSIEMQFQAFIISSNVIKTSYKDVFINHSNTKFTLCPTVLYSPENTRTLLEFNIGHTSDSVIKTDEINHDIQCIYAIPELLNSTIDKLLPSHKSKNTLSVLCQLFLSAEEFSSESVLLYLYKNLIYIIVKDKHKLLLANTFDVNTQEDVLYYLLFTLEQFELNPLTVKLAIAGNTETNNTLITSVKKYIKEVRFATGNKSIHWENLKGIPQHFNYSLINRLYCVS
jgi:hypothetical protein